MYESGFNQGLHLKLSGEEI